MTRLGRVGLCVLVATRLGAQERNTTASGGALVMRVLQGDQSRFKLRSGTLLGAEGQFRTGNVSLTIRGLSGTLSPDSSGIGERQFRRTDVSLQLSVTPWLALGADAQALRFESGSTATLWRLYGPSVALSGALGAEGLRGEAEVAIFPAGQVVPKDSLGIPVRLEVGLGYAPARSRLGFRVGYRVDVIYLDAKRAERLGGLLGGVSLRLR